MNMRARMDPRKVAIVEMITDYGLTVLVVGVVNICRRMDLKAEIVCRVCIGKDVVVMADEDTLNWVIYLSDRLRFR